MGLSIEGAPPVDNLDANQALLLAAGRLADFYMLLGNEAYADASDPTITLAGTLTGSSTALHAFMNQTSNLLEEELALLRGRDDASALRADTSLLQSPDLEFCPPATARWPTPASSWRHQ